MSNKEIMVDLDSGQDILHGSFQEHPQIIMGF
jgi:hypothetical protein